MRHQGILGYYNKIGHSIELGYSLSSKNEMVNGNLKLNLFSFNPRIDSIPLFDVNYSELGFLINRKQKTFSINCGFEFTVIKKFKLKPFFGIDILAGFNTVKQDLFYFPSVNYSEKTKSYFGGISPNLTLAYEYSKTITPFIRYSKVIWFEIDNSRPIILHGNQINLGVKIKFNEKS
ncbi:MAG: hypothetical protein ACK479_17050 [Fluviicola sp.]